MKITCTPVEAQAILASAQIQCAAPDVELIKTHNHIFRITTPAAVYFLKTYTKDWYQDCAIGVVTHEAGGFSALATRGIPAAAVVLSCDHLHNPLQRPFLLTRQLRGEPLTKLLRESSPHDFKALLGTTGSHLRRCHEIVFNYPGYVGSPEGPSSPHEPGQWIHPYCSAAKMQQEALAGLHSERNQMPPELFAAMVELLSSFEHRMQSEYYPPRFIHGDCHASHFFLYQENGSWQVSGSIDMEVAASGAPICDLMKFSNEMVTLFPHTSHWWKPLFDGYGGEPSFEAMKLLFLCEWADRRERLLQARDWEALFSAL